MAKNNSGAESTRTAGSYGEDLASKELQKLGYTVICRNYTCRGGEIDILASKGEYLFFAEVKMRKQGTGDNAAEAVDKIKAQRIRTACRSFMNEYRDNPLIENLVPNAMIIEVYTGKETKIHILACPGLLSES